MHNWQAQCRVTSRNKHYVSMSRDYEPITVKHMQRHILLCYIDAHSPSQRIHGVIFDAATDSNTKVLRWRSHFQLPPCYDNKFTGVHPAAMWFDSGKCRHVSTVFRSVLTVTQRDKAVGYCIISRLSDAARCCEIVTIAVSSYLLNLIV